jgi:TolB-like protein
MSDVFISYARSTAPVAERIATALKAMGHDVWWDDQLPAHRAYADVIEERLRAAKAVIVVWSADAAKSHWVRAEADLARNAGTLVQISVDAVPPPLPFNQIQCVELGAWSGDPGAPAWRKVVASIGALVGEAKRVAVPAAAPVVAAARSTLLAVLAFDNLSNDAELSYFSDGVSEEILYTVARAKGLRVVGKASSFQFRGADKAVHKVASALGATHVLDGSVRRSGNSIRINAELVDTGSCETLWNERYDRALTDIFALQDEIAAAIAKALDHHFAPAATAISVDPAAYDLYLKARANYEQDQTWADRAKCLALLEGAVVRDPNYAAAWGRLGVYRRGEAALAAARRGLELDPDCAMSLVALSMTKPAFAEHAEKIRLSERAYLRVPDDQLIAGIYMQFLVTAGLLTRACEVADDRVTREPLSPLIAGGRLMAYRSLGKLDTAKAIAEQAASDFPDSAYLNFMLAVLAIYDGDYDRAAMIVTDRLTGTDAMALQGLVMFVRMVTAMPPEARADAISQFLRRGTPVNSIVDIGLAAALGETEQAMTRLLTVIRNGERLEFATENDGRGPTGPATTIGLFMPNCEVLRRDVRFAEVCVRLGLYDCWVETGLWPDCAAEVAPLYDLKAECARLAATTDRYVAKV